MKKDRGIYLLLSVIVGTAIAFTTHERPQTGPPPEVVWADSVYESMSEQERLGQLFMIRAHSDKGEAHERQVRELIRKYKVGGLCFFQGTPERQVALINDYQEIASPLPLMVAIDGEWGLGMRLKNSTISFPKQLTLGAIRDNRLIYEMGAEIARQLKLVGVHVNFAPVADVNNNPANPVINERSFGEDRLNVAVKSYNYARGMEDHGIMACAKHFPGHGDTDVDSHHDLPVIRHPLSRLDSVELFPFRVLAEKGIGSMMVAHLHVPTFDERENRPTTLSYNTVTRLLQQGLGFDGLIFTDALEMKGVTKHFAPGEVEAEALLAGNDVLLLPEDIEAAFREIRAYLKAGKLQWKELEKSIKKILRAKYRLGLRRFEPLREDSLRARLNTGEAIALKRQLLAEALTLVRNPNDLIPFRDISGMQVASLSIGAEAPTPFQKRLLDYKQMPVLQTDKSVSKREAEQLLQQLEAAELVIVGLHGMSSSARRDFGISSSTRRLLYDLSQRKKVVLSVFGNPYSLRYFDRIPWVLQAYEESPEMQALAAEALFGALPIKGRLPITASEKSAFGKGVFTRQLSRFGYAPPESMGMDSATLGKIDRLMEKAIATRATPGGVVLVAKNNKIVYERAFGHHTYEAEKKVDKHDLYDLASLTKIASATLAVMKLYEQGKVALDTPMVRYLPNLEGTDKAELCLRDIMAHRAGLKDWIPFYKQTIYKNRRRRVRHRSAFYRSKAEQGYSLEVAEDLYLRNDIADSIFQAIRRSPLRPSPGYNYSDLGFYLIAEMVEALSGMPLDEYVDRHFFQPLGLQTACYRPLEQFPKARIAPTEKDRYFRLQTIHGYVHDMGAAMLGGVSGHAGLFADAKDVAILLQMLLNGGHYGGQRFLQAHTIRTFAHRHPEGTRRGLGFDMRQLDPSKWINLPADASKATFGHTGFTGTCAWADPEEELVYVFLSNRTFPTMNNYKLNKLRTRRRILSTVYEAIDQYQYFTALSTGSKERLAKKH